MVLFTPMVYRLWCTGMVQRYGLGLPGLVFRSNVQAWCTGSGVHAWCTGPGVQGWVYRSGVKVSCTGLV